MYVLLVIGLAIAVIMVEASAWGLSNVTMLFDVPSLLLLMIIGISMLLAAGLGKDFLAAFRLALGKEGQAGLRERQRAVEAVELFMKSLRYGGVFGLVLQFISIYGLLEDAAMWSVHLSVLLILPLYAYAINLLLLPVKSRLKLGMIEYMQEAGTEDGGRADIVNLQSGRTEIRDMGGWAEERLAVGDRFAERKGAKGESTEKGRTGERMAAEDWPARKSMGKGSTEGEGMGREGMKKEGMEREGMEREGMEKEAVEGKGTERAE